MFLEVLPPIFSFASEEQSLYIPLPSPVNLSQEKRMILFAGSSLLTSCEKQGTLAELPCSIHFGCRGHTGVYADTDRRRLIDCGSSQIKSARKGGADRHCSDVRERG